MIEILTDILLCTNLIFFVLLGIAWLLLGISWICYEWDIHEQKCMVRLSKVTGIAIPVMLLLDVLFYIGVK